MKKYLPLLLTLATSPLAHAAQRINGEADDLVRLPRPIADAVNALAPADAVSCQLRGKRLALARSRHALWFVSSSCGGSGGEPLYLVLSAPGRARVILSAGTNYFMEVSDHDTAGLPDISVTGGTSMSTDTLYYRFSGRRYQQSGHAWQAPFTVLTAGDASKDEAGAITDFKNTGNCNLQSGDLDHYQHGNPLTLVYASCKTGARYPTWILAKSPAPLHVILSDASIQPGNDAGALRSGPGSSHGLPDLCLMQPDAKKDQADDSWSCWRFDGSIYRHQ